MIEVPTGTSTGRPSGPGWSHSTGGGCPSRSNPMMTQRTAARPGTSEVHGNVRWANRIRQPSRTIGRNSRAGWSPWVTELVVTKANAPGRSASSRSVRACHPVA